MLGRFAAELLSKSSALTRGAVLGASGAAETGIKYAGKKMLTSPVFGMATTGVGVGALTYDSSGPESFSSHMLAETAGTMADIPADLAVWGITEGLATGALAGMGVGGLPGAIIGAGAALATTSAMYAFGLNPGGAVRETFRAAGKKYSEERFGKSPIRQNKMTMEATQRSMALLGQSRPMNMLGKEASFMHN